MIRACLLRSVGLAVLLGLLTWIFLRAGAVSPHAHYHYLEQLRDMQQADVETSAEVLASRDGLVRNHDALVAHVRRVRAGLAAAAEPPAFLGARAGRAVREKAGELAAAFEAKADLIDRYQRGNAVFRNSLDYFPQAAEDFLRQADGRRTLDHYGRFVRQTLILGGKPTPELVLELGAQLDTLAGLKLPPAERAALDHVLPHARTILVRHPEVNGLVKDILAAPTALRLEELTRLYAAGHEESQRVAGYFRLLLYAAALLLVFYSVHAYLRIEKKRGELAEANIELENRFAAQRRAEERVRLYATVFTDAAEGMTITDAEERILAVNPAFCAITGYTPEEVLGKTPAVLGSGRQNAQFYRQMWSALQTAGKWSGEIWNRRKDGNVYPEWLSITAVKNELGADSHFIGIFTDITERKEVEARIHHLAHHDALTGLPNRLLLEDRIDQAVLQARRGNHPAAVMLLDLDRFKNINDTLGHDVGDQLLVEAAQRGLSVLRETDTLSRQGGDEFVVVLPGLESVQDVGAIARKLLQAIGRPYHLAGHELMLTGSLGIALCPEDGTTASELLRNADTAMYRAKEEGRGTYRFYAADMNFAALGELLLESSLRTALDRGELRLHYQPKIDARDGKLIGAEALMRWEHPEHGLIPPARFIPLAEECGLIGALGEWAIYAVCRQQRAWIDAGLTPVPVAVNVSARQFAQQDVPGLVADALRESGLPSALLAVELTESLLMHDAVHAAAELGRLREMDIDISIDDFGTGYSSLSYLEQFPVQKLKIDRSFVQVIDPAAGPAKLVVAIIALAHSMGMEVIAEGVETETQRDYLASQGCDQFQGYIFDRPLEAEAFAHRLAAASA